MVKTQTIIDTKCRLIFFELQRVSFYPNHRFSNTIDTTLSKTYADSKQGERSAQGLCYLSTNFETRYLLNFCSNHSIDKKIYFHLNICRRLHLVYLEIYGQNTKSRVHSVGQFSPCIKSVSTKTFVLLVNLLNASDVIGDVVVK